jgi:hypothetical protein
VICVCGLAVCTTGGYLPRIVSGASSALQDRLLEVLPFTVPFPTRAAQFTATRTAIRQSEQIAQASYRVVVQRARLFEASTHNTPFKFEDCRFHAQTLVSLGCCFFGLRANRVRMSP